jgi:hypothetical protein
MNDTYPQKNKLAKQIALKAADLLEHFQWGKQSVSNQVVLETISDLEKEIDQLKQSLRD